MYRLVAVKMRLFADPLLSNGFCVVAFFLQQLGSKIKFSDTEGNEKKLERKTNP
jgi:hypothetical protein